MQFPIFLLDTEMCNIYNMYRISMLVEFLSPSYSALITENTEVEYLPITNSSFQFQ